MEVANDLSNNIHDESEVGLPEMSQFYLNPLTNNESNIFTFNNDGICQAQEYSCGKFSGKLFILIIMILIGLTNIDWIPSNVVTDTSNNQASSSGRESTSMYCDQGIKLYKSKYPHSRSWQVSLPQIGFPLAIFLHSLLPLPMRRWLRRPH